MLRLSFGSIECHSIGISSCWPIFKRIGCDYFVTFLQTRTWKQGWQAYIFGRLHYWTVHDVVPVEEESEGLYNNIPPQMQCFRLNLRRNIFLFLLTSEYLLSSLEEQNSQRITKDPLSPIAKETPHYVRHVSLYK